MKAGQKLWTRDELILTINLYIKLPFGKMDSRNTSVKELAQIIGRSPNAVALKLVNFASLDPSLQSRGIKGMSHASSIDKKVWSEFYQNWDAKFLESEAALATQRHMTVEQMYEEEYAKDLIGKEEVRNVKVRINQFLFRRILLANYDSSCCITGINNPNLLIAAHIVQWSQDQNNRLNPKNGLLLNPLHDRAFELGLITIDEKYKILVSSILKKQKTMNRGIKDNFLKYEGKSIQLPKKFKPDLEFLRKHNERFQQ